jgi:hypothetical protein
VPRLNFEEWLLDGCSAFLDYSHQERAIVDAFLASIRESNPERTVSGH